MSFRYFRQVSTGQWTNATLGGSALEIPPASHIQDIAAGLGIDPADLEAVDSDLDPRDGVQLELPTRPFVPTADEALKNDMAAAVTPQDGLAAMKRWADARPG